MQDQQTYHFLNKGHFKYRWFLLGFCIWIVAGAFFCFDVPAALHNTLKSHFSDVLSDGEFEIYFGGLYSIYSFANIFLPFVTGRMRDKMGDRIILLMTVTFVFIGQVVFAYGVINKSFLIMYIGRIILGWGIESVQPIQTSFVSPYFKDDYLGLTIGMNTLFAGFGSVATMYLCPLIALKYGLIYAVTVGALFNVFCIFTATISTIIDKCAEQETLEHVDYQKAKFMILAQEEQISDFSGEPQHEVPLNVGTFEQIRSYPKLFWLVAFYFGLNYSSVLGFINISVGFLTERWLGEDEDSELQAGQMIAMMWLITGFFTPIFGYIADKYGGRSTHVFVYFIQCILAAVLCFVAQLTLWYIYPFLSLIALGTATAIAYASPWTGVVYLVRPDFIGKAYGAVVGIYNAMFSVVPIIVGVLRAHYGSYYYSQAFLAFLGLCSLIIAIMIKIEDEKQENMIDGKKQPGATSIEEFCKNQENGIPN